MASQRILVLVKPDGVRRHLTGEVVRRIETKGYTLSNIAWVRASEEKLARHYSELINRPFYPALVEYMMSGPMVAAIFVGDRVIEGVRSLAGATDPTTAAPGTIRGDFGRAWNGEATMNIIHASDSPESAEREIAIWFGEDQG